MGKARVQNIAKNLDSMNLNGEELPSLLPMVHMTNVGKFREILKTGIIKPAHCSVLKERVSFLHYGFGVYRYDKEKKEENYPVSIMYQPKLINFCASFIPYDSGALSLNLYDDKYNSKLSNINIYKVQLPKFNKEESIRKFVYAFYLSLIHI